VVISSLLKGGQLAKKCRPLDRLESVDNRSTVGMSLHEVRRLISGIDGTPVTLTFTRRGLPGKIFSTVTRTSSELQDLQVAVLEDVLSLIRTTEDPQDESSVYSTAQRNSWRSPTSYDGQLFNEVCEGIRNLKMQSNPRGTLNPDISRINRELQIAQNAADSLRKELRDRDLHDVASVTLAINETPSSLHDKSARKRLQEALQADICKALGLADRRLEVVGMHRGDPNTSTVHTGFELDLNVLPVSVNAPASEPTARSVAAELVNQAGTPGSPLRLTPFGRTVTHGTHRSNYEYVHRLRHTVRMLQDEVGELEGRTGSQGKGQLVELAQKELELAGVRAELHRKDAAARDLEKRLAQTMRESYSHEERARSGVGDMRSENQRLQQRIAEMEQDSVRQSDLLKGINEDKENTEKEVARLRSVLDAAAAQRQSVEAELQRLRAQEYAAGNSSDQLRAAEQQNERLQVQLQALVQEREALRADLKDVEEIKNQHQQELWRRTEEASQSRSQMNPLRSELQDARQKLARLAAVEKENSQLAASLQQVQQDKVKHGVENEKLRHMVTQLNNQITLLSREVGRARSEQIAGNSAGLQVDQMATHNESLKVAYRELEKKNEDLNAELNRLRMKFEAIHAKKSEAETMASRMMAQTDVARAQQESLQDDNTRYQGVVDKLTRENTALKHENSLFKSSLTEHENMTRSQQSEVQRLKQSTDAQISQLLEDLNAQKIFIKQLQDAVSNLSAENDNLRGENSRINHLFKGLEEEKSLLEDENRLQKERISKYGEVHALDVRDTSKKDEALQAKDMEIVRLRDLLRHHKGGPSSVPDSSLFPPDRSSRGQSIFNPISALLSAHSPVSSK